MLLTLYSFQLVDRMLVNVNETDISQGQLQKVFYNFGFKL